MGWEMVTSESDKKLFFFHSSCSRMPPISAIEPTARHQQRGEGCPAAGSGEGAARLTDVESLGFRVKGLGLGIRVQGSGLCLGFRVEGLGFTI